MPRKVLGDDPFAATLPAKKPAKKPAEKPAKKPLGATTKKSAKKPLGAAQTAVAPPATVDAPPPPPPEPVAPAAPVEARPRLDEILGVLDGDASLRARVLEALGAAEPEPRPAPEAAEPEALAPTSEAADDGAMMASEFYRQHWGRIAMRDRSEATDDFGLDPAYEARWRPAWEFLYDRWWRVEVEGIHHIPSEGPAALVANHGGAVPFDGVMLSTAVRREHPAQRQLRWLAEDFVFHMPFAGAFVNRIGAVRACQENAERLIRQGNLVALFPEGVKGIGKLYKDRYKLQRFGRGGHIKLAIRTRSPIIPVTIVGNEDTHPMLAGSDRLAKLLGMPYVPITPTFPLLGPLGLLPLPAKWRIIFGEPIAVAHLPAEAADDELLVGRLNEKLRATIQDTLDRALRERVSVFKG
ncbi:MAG: lysophospholipid acyltransferase family protein [Polyangiales bacterium]